MWIENGDGHCSYGSCYSLHTFSAIGNVLIVAITRLYFLWFLSCLFSLGVRKQVWYILASPMTLHVYEDVGVWRAPGNHILFQPSDDIVSCNL